MWDGPLREGIPFASPVRAVGHRHLQFNPQPSIPSLWEQNVGTEGERNVYAENNISGNNINNNNNRIGKGRCCGNREQDVSFPLTRPLSFPVSAITNEEDGVFVQHTPFFTAESEEVEKNGMDEHHELSQCIPENNHHWFQEEAECSQRSTTSCRTQTAVMTMIQPSDPGAPKKGPGRTYLYTEVDESYIPNAKMMLCQHFVDTLNGNNNNNNNSISMPCESSILSHITPLEEVDESIDLANQMSRLIVAASPTQKRLVFSGPFDESNGVVKEEVEGKRMRSSSIDHGQQQQQSRRGKRFLEELDANCDSSASSPTYSPTSEVNRKCRRVDTGDRAKSRSYHRETNSECRIIGDTCLMNN
ncbi:putative kinesin [Trypanosoma theileri]|uniref:Putative kinesin n=1 Tax=Trypanosoma theileri TaxID=67003 RepID=A0A1X0P1H5_9TRYP|nr:putative kinesin [Trypanosoma theileri]ORC90369.1 putative kinesin [Trypanosoma theileri]